MSTDLLNIQEQLRKELELQRASLPAASTGRIKTTGKKFTLPGGQPTEGPMEAIIVSWRYANAYYPGVYNRNNPQPAACTAVGRVEHELVPLKSSPNKQSDDCASCKMNEWGSATNGGKGKACKNGIRLAIVPASATEDDTPLILDVTPTGVKSFKNYINVLNSADLLPAQVVTSIDFDATVDYPSLTFKALKEHDKVGVVFGMSDLANSLLNQ